MISSKFVSISYDVYFELYSPVPLPLDALMDGLILTTLSYGKMSDLFWLKMPSCLVLYGNKTFKLNTLVSLFQYLVLDSL